MRFLPILISQFVFVCMFSQTNKPTYYSDVDGANISKTLFYEKYRNRNDGVSHLSIVFENDTSYIQLLVRRKNYGKLKLKDFEILQKQLTNSNENPIEKYTIIQYHPGKDRCNGGNFNGNMYKKRYLKKLKKHFDFTNYWIHKKDNNLTFNKPKHINWQIDLNQTVEHLFFKFHYNCSSFVIINNETKNYISIFGEYGEYAVKKIAEEMKKS